ncbi:hypothetical protein M5689_019218 [Euphorbia peplus]|nr:hypothetical protein M5689_019218 [Euphorbia peplus]
MASINISSASKTIFAFLCIFMILNGGKINAGESTPEGSLVYQGPCANYPNCNKHCKDTNGAKVTGSCQQSGNDDVCFCNIG